MNGKMTAKKWEKTAADKKADASARAWQKGPKGSGCRPQRNRRLQQAERQEVNQEDSAKIVAEFQKRFRIAESAESKNREIWKKDRRFVYHDEAQWEDSGRDTDRPKVTVNRLRCSPAISSTRHGKALSRSRFTRSTSSGQAPANVVSGLLRNTGTPPTLRMNTRAPPRTP